MTTSNIHLYEIVFGNDGNMKLIDCQTMMKVEHPEMILKSGMEVRVFEREIEIDGNRKYKKIITKSIYLEYIDTNI